jgi:hypothetical protein
VANKYALTGGKRWRLRRLLEFFLGSRNRRAAVRILGHAMEHVKRGTLQLKYSVKYDGLHEDEELDRLMAVSLLLKKWNDLFLPKWL